MSVRFILTRPSAKGTQERRLLKKARRSSIWATSTRRPLRVNLLIKLLLETLKEYFVKFGEITAIYLIYNLSTDTSRGFGFIEYKDEDVALKVSRLKNHYIDEKNQKVVTRYQTQRKIFEKENETFMPEDYGLNSMPDQGYSEATIPPYYNDIYANNYSPDMYNYQQPQCNDYSQYYDYYNQAPNNQYYNYQDVGTQAGYYDPQYQQDYYNNGWNYTNDNAAYGYPSYDYSDYSQQGTVQGQYYNGTEYNGNEYKGNDYNSNEYNYSGDSYYSNNGSYMSNGYGGAERV